MSDIEEPPADEEALEASEGALDENNTRVSAGLEKHEYKNWVKAAKGLEFLQEGLQPFVDRQVAAKHTEFTLKLPTLPSGRAPCGCTFENLLPDHDIKLCKIKNCLCKRKLKTRRKCPDNYCSTFCQLVLAEHSFDDPSWYNTDISKWPTDHWNLARCFMTTKGPGLSARSTDSPGLLNVILNAKFFLNKISHIADIKNNKFTKARDERNNILHKAQLELSDDDLAASLDAFVDVLRDPVTLHNDPDAAKAVKRLEYLKANQIHISTEEEEEILKKRKESIKVLKEIEEKRIKFLQEIEEEKDKILVDIEQKKVESLQEIDTVTAGAKETLEQEQENILVKLNEAKDSALSEIHDVGGENTTAIANLNEQFQIINIKLEELKIQTKKNSRICAIIPIDQDGEPDIPSDEEDTEDEGDNETKLKTDESVLVGVNDVEIQLRDYQEELAVEGLKGKNVIIVAPTNTGKTTVACRIVQEHFRSRKRDGKLCRVIFLVENEALALQQGKVFERLLPAHRTKVISGSLQRDKKQYLKDFLDKRDIFVVTAQVLLNDLKSKDIDSVAKFSMLIFDECHHTNQQHMFNEIMGFYLNLKLDEKYDKQQLPQVVGLTASLGVGGSTSKEAGMEHMKDVMANLDADCLCTVQHHKDQLQEFANKAKEHIVVALKRDKDGFTDAVLETLLKIENHMTSHKCMSELPKEDEFIKLSCHIPSSAGTESFQNWLSDFKKNIVKLKTDTARKMLFSCQRHLEVYHKILKVHADARVKDARKVLTDFIESEKGGFKQKQKAYENPQDEELQTERFLLDLADDFISMGLENEDNPKLLVLQDIVLRTLGQKLSKRGIVFVKTRSLALALENWMNETEDLKGLNANACIGQGSPDEKGLTKRLQRQILKYFKKGRHRVIIATSVVEEGLDITSCNLVVRYEHVTNEIVRLQSRGRARAKNSLYFVITEEDSWIVDKERKNSMLEGQMNEIVEVLQRVIKDNPEGWMKDKAERQKTKKIKQKLKEVQRSANISDDVKNLHCKQCNAFICHSSDIRRIKESQHVVIDENVKKRLVIIRKPNPKFKNDELKFDGDTKCKDSKCNFKLGGVCEYLGKEFPLLAIKSFRIVDKEGNGRDFKKWKDVNFHVETFSLEELGKVGTRCTDEASGYQT